MSIKVRGELALHVLTCTYQCYSFFLLTSNMYCIHMRKYTSNIENQTYCRNRNQNEQRYMKSQIISAISTPKYINSVP